VQVCAARRGPLNNNGVPAATMADRVHTMGSVRVGRRRPREHTPYARASVSIRPFVAGCTRPDAGSRKTGSSGDQPFLASFFVVPRTSPAGLVGRVARKRPRCWRAPPGAMLDHLDPDPRRRALVCSNAARAWAAWSGRRVHPVGPARQAWACRRPAGRIRSRPRRCAAPGSGSERRLSRVEQRAATISSIFFLVEATPAAILVLHVAALDSRPRLVDDRMMSRRTGRFLVTGRRAGRAGQDRNDLADPAPTASTATAIAPVGLPSTSHARTPGAFSPSSAGPAARDKRAMTLRGPRRAILLPVAGPPASAGRPSGRWRCGRGITGRHDPPPDALGGAWPASVAALTAATSRADDRGAVACRRSSRPDELALRLAIASAARHCRRNL